MGADVVFPISIRFEDGKVEEFQNREDLELDWNISIQGKPAIAKSETSSEGACG